MKIIAKERDKMPYMRPLKNEEPGKKIFSKYVEGFVCDALGLERAESPIQKGYDAIIPKTGKKVEIKDTTHSRPVIGNEPQFDYLVTVELNKKDFSIKTIAIYPLDFVISHIGKKEISDINRQKTTNMLFIITINGL